MALSGSTDFNLTRDNLIKVSLRRVGAQSFSPTSIEYTEAGVILNSIAREWAARGIGIWKNTEVTLTLDTTSQSYTLGPNSTDTTSPAAIAKPLSIFNVRRVDSNGDEFPVGMKMREDYMSIVDKSETGPVTYVYYDSQRTDGTLYVYPVSDTAEYLKFTASMPFDDFDSSTDDADFTPECYRALMYALTCDLADEPRYAVPDNYYVRIKQKALESFDVLLGITGETGSMWMD